MTWTPGNKHFMYAALVGVFLMAGCNLFTDMHNNGVDSNSNVLTADGQAALARGDYNNAVVYFNRAVEHDPGNSEARVGLAEALIKRKKFNLANFIKTLSSGTQNQTSNTLPELIKLSDWNCDTYADLDELFTQVIGALDPIATGHTHGPYASSDSTVNLNVGFVYLLRTAARIQELTTAAYQVVQISKNNLATPAELQTWLFNNLQITVDLTLTQAEYDQLPDSFYWISPTPNAAVLTQAQNDIDTGIARLHAAATTATSRKMIDDITNMFSSLQLQVH